MYPLTVIKDRYGGIYSGGKYIAFELEYTDIPEEVSGDDVSCMSFWCDCPYIVGKGDTPEAAIKDLEEQNKTLAYFEETPHEFLVLEPEDWTQSEWKTLLKLFALEYAQRIVVKDYKLQVYGKRL